MRSLRIADTDTFKTGGIGNSKRKLCFLCQASAGERKAQQPERAPGASTVGVVRERPLPIDSKRRMRSSEAGAALKSPVK
ncbi:hypothetical protein [Parabacteroides chongii]|uniref:hypothetical protein n=1 Tax=Parabacteroides chongii TaxID=2685834 RepID=UPI00240E4B6E|nr:hypothetical protein [Parabacteroides chongii]WFE84359.1 hypothetical protein P3L47_19815 [Parabacteroides chongii]